MSYILEALKKLEQKRQEEETPSLLTPQRNAAPVRKKRPFWPYIVSGIVLLNIMLVGLLFWIGPLKKSPPIPPPQSQVAHEKTQPPQTSAPLVKKEEPIVETEKAFSPPEQKDVTQSPPGQASPPAPVPMKAIPETIQPRTIAVQPTPPIKPSAEPSPREVKPVKPAKPSTKVVSIKELPNDLRSKLPELKMTVHSYTEQAQSRFVVINNSTAREGQFVNGELKLEQITPNGVILNYQGHRFSLGINENP
jgi:general secretion pathway protein B